MIAIAGGAAIYSSFASNSDPGNSNSDQSVQENSAQTTTESVDGADNGTTVEKKTSTQSSSGSSSGSTKSYTRVTSGGRTYKSTETTNPDGSISVHNSYTPPAPGIQP